MASQQGDGVVGGLSDGVLFIIKIGLSSGIDPEDIVYRQSRSR
tara:strand:+ start:619 stop:747 length:129 start_codon:yes stop_codon:yes gene_type:complete